VSRGITLYSITVLSFSALYNLKELISGCIGAVVAWRAGPAVCRVKGLVKVIVSTFRTFGNIFLVSRAVVVWPLNVRSTSLLFD
jgi:hypothetical protein